MAMAGQFAVEESTGTIPATMQAAVYRGVNDVRLETVPVPQIGAGELLLRVHTCGICGTDLKKIATGFTFRTPNFWPRDLRDGGSRGRRRPGVSAG